MVDGGILMYELDGTPIQNPEIFKEIRSRRFGVLLAITQGIQSSERAVDTRRQIKRGKLLLEKVVGDSAEIYAGLALSKTNQKEISDIDFSLQVPNYGGNFESYVLGLFDGVLRNDPQFKLATLLQDTEVRSERFYHADLIIATDYSDFERGLDQLEKRFPRTEPVTRKSSKVTETVTTSGKRSILSCSHDRSYRS